MQAVKIEKPKAVVTKEAPRRIKGWEVELSRAAQAAAQKFKPGVAAPKYKDSLQEEIEQVANLPDFGLKSDIEEDVKGNGFEVRGKALSAGDLIKEMQEKQLWK